MMIVIEFEGCVARQRFRSGKSTMVSAHIADSSLAWTMVHLCSAVLQVLLGLWLLDRLLSSWAVLTKAFLLTETLLEQGTSGLALKDSTL
jgi:hypothetical protein